MKLMVKTLQGSQFAVEVADDIGVKDLKGVIAKTQGDDAFSPADRGARLNIVPVGRPLPRVTQVRVKK